MTSIRALRRWALIGCIGILYGCAGAQTTSSYNSVEDSIGGDNLDLLFATEFPVASKEEAIAKSKMAYRDGDLNKALFYSVKALKFDTGDIDIIVRIGHLHMLQGNSRMAARSFRLALAQDPEHAESRQGLGLLYFKAEQPDKARENLEKAVAADPSLWRSFNVLGVLADDRGEYPLAWKYYDKALATRPDSVSVLINRGYSKYLAGELRTAARYLYDVASQSDHPKAWRNLGMVYAELGWYDEALEVFRKIEDEADAYNSTGAIALANDDLSVAEEFLSEAVHHSPVYFAEAERNLARVRREQGE